MWHSNRDWCVAPIESAEMLARKLADMTWCCCQAFVIGDYFWLNDSTSPDGAQEYAVLKREGDKFVQIESITFGWMDHDSILQAIQDTLAGNDDENDFRKDVVPTLETPEVHNRCQHCA